MSSAGSTDHPSTHIASKLKRAANEPDYDETLLHKLADDIAAIIRRKHGNEVTKEQIIFAVTMDIDELDRTAAFEWERDAATSGYGDVCLRRKFAPEESWLVGFREEVDSGKW